MANYTATILSTALAESKEKHTPSVRIQVNAIHNLDTDEDCDKKFTADLWLSDKAVERTIKTLRSLGFEGQSMAELNDPDTMTGLMCEVTTRMEPYEGETVERVAFVNKPGSFANRGLRAASEDVARSIAQRYDAALRTGKYHKPPQKQAAYGRQEAPRPNPYAPKKSAPAAPEQDEDDLPF